MGENMTRRTVLRGAGAMGAVAASAASLAACGSSSPSTSATTSSAAPTTGSATTQSTATATGSATTSGSGAASGTKVAKADIPVSGGKIVGAIVVTQPSAGTFKAFTSTCTHMGCTVGQVTNNKIMCPCHGSGYDASTGAVVNGPATRGLATKTVSDSGDSVVVS